MAKKIRLIDEDTEEVNDDGVVTTQSVSGTVKPSLTPEQVEQLMKYAEAIDWKLWEILKLLRSKIETPE